ncbi:MAG: hypothetical protein AB1646_09280 [Thermodesulfobacteriota bacterium]
MASARTIRTRELVKDIREELSGPSLRKKYGLSQDELRYCLERLLIGGAISRDEHDRTVSGRRAFDEVELTGIVTRRFRRVRTECRKVFISEIGAPSNRGRAWDISEDGLKTVGIPAAPGEIKNLVVTFGDIRHSPSISFDAECRWIATEGVSHERMAGFEIVMISDEDLKLLRLVIQAYSHPTKRTHRHGQVGRQQATPCSTAQ